MNSEQTTKQQPSASPHRPSKLCRLLLVALSVKLVLLGGLMYDALKGDMPVHSFPSSAHAAQAGAGAAPATPIISPLPEAGATTASPGSQAPAIGKGSGYGSTSLPGIGAAGATSQIANATAASTPDLSREALIRRQDELARKEEELRNLEKDLNARLEQMQVLENRLQIMINDAKGTTDAKLRHLVDVLSNMKARQAATVMETLDQRIAVKVLANMRGRQAGEILTFMNAERAAGLAEALSRMQMPLE